MRLDLERLFDDAARARPDRLYDSRFRCLVSRDGWDRLEPTIQRRFSKRLKGIETTVEQGRPPRVGKSALIEDELTVFS